MDPVLVDEIRRETKYAEVAQHYARIRLARARGSVARTRYGTVFFALATLVSGYTFQGSFLLLTIGLLLVAALINVLPYGLKLYRLEDSFRQVSEKASEASQAWTRVEWLVRYPDPAAIDVVTLARQASSTLEETLQGTVASFELWRKCEVEWEIANSLEAMPPPATRSRGR